MTLHGRLALYVPKKAERPGFVVRYREGGGGGGGLERAKFGMAKFGAVNIWHQFVKYRGKFWSKIRRLWHKNTHTPQL